MSEIEFNTNLMNQNVISAAPLESRVLMHVAPNIKHIHVVKVPPVGDKIISFQILRSSVR